VDFLADDAAGVDVITPIARVSQARASTRAK
jgi:hypothetical protein